jgi:hypothetical protein
MLHNAHSPLKRKSTYKPSPAGSQAPLIVKVLTSLLSKGARHEERRCSHLFPIPFSISLAVGSSRFNLRGKTR